jgi:hypothetical protein
MLSKELEEEVLQAVDRGAWKHSWHLKLSPWGNIDFNSEENLSKIIEVLQKEVSYGIKVAARADRLLPLLSAQLRRAVDERESAALEAESTPEVLSTEQAESTPAFRN